MVSTATSRPSPSPFYHHTNNTQQKKKTMSITQTYFLAHQARAKLSNEAARPDHNLRLLVGHANLLDSLMVDLADAEREQESWFNQSVRGASQKNSSQERHVQWADSLPEVDDSDSDSDESDLDYDDDEDELDYDEDINMVDAPLRRIPSSPRLPTISIDEVDMMEEDDDEEDIAALTLTRSPSHSASGSPPELLEDEDSEDDSMPPSPPIATFPTFAEADKTNSQKQQQQQQEEDSTKSDFYEEGFYLPPRNPNRLISAISVY